MHKITMGGSETSLFYLKQFVEIPSWINLSLNSPTIDPTKVNIHWQHQSYDQPSVQILTSLVDQLDLIVFVSYWQQEKYRQFLKIPTHKSIVIKNAILPVRQQSKHSDKIKLVYSSTPFRGLDILLDAMDIITRTDIELHVFSSMKLYGESYYHLEKNYQHLYDRCQKDPRISYHGVVDQEYLHEFLSQANIWAYPNTWEETSCIAAIEAMSAGCLLVCSDLGALPETTSGFAQMYSPNQNHSKQYAKILDNAINNYKQGKYSDQLRAQSSFANNRFNWHTRASEWKELFESYSQTKNIWRL